MIFVNPYEEDLALIGTTDIQVEGDPGSVQMDESEEAYLLAVLGRYFKAGPTPADIIHRFSGVRPLLDDDAANPSAVTRDYTFDVDPGAPDAGHPPLLSIFGGKITTYRKLAEHALDRLKPFFPGMRGTWTAGAPMPGGDIPDADFEGWLGRLARSYPWLPPPLLRHYGRLYGTRAERLIGAARGLDDLGRHFGGRLYEREARFLVDEEWAETAEDILMRRTKHHLHLTAAECQAFGAWLDGSRPQVSTQAKSA